MGKHEEVSTISLIRARRAEIKAARDALDAEDKELDAAERVLIRLNAANGGRSRRTPKKSLVQVSKNEAVITLGFGDMTIVQAAEVLLKERGNKPTHYREMAKEALARGFRPRKGANETAVGFSFWHLMRRNPETFDFRDKGMFCLKESSE